MPSQIVPPRLTQLRICESPTKNIRWYSKSGMYSVLIPGQSLISKYFFHIEDAQSYLRGDKPIIKDSIEVKDIWDGIDRLSA